MTTLAETLVPGLNEVRSGRPEQWLASEGGPDKELYQPLRALRLAGLHNTPLLSCQGVKHLVKPLRALPRGDDTTGGLAAAHTTTDPSSGNLPGTPKHNGARRGGTIPVAFPRADAAQGSGRVFLRSVVAPVGCAVARVRKW